MYRYGVVLLSPDYEIEAIGYSDHTNRMYHLDYMFSYRVFDWGDYFTR